MHMHVRMCMHIFFVHVHMCMNTSMCAWTFFYCFTKPVVFVGRFVRGSHLVEPGRPYLTPTP